MNSASLLVTAAGAHLLAVMSPGPDFAMVSRQTLAHGRAAGLRTAWGIATGIVFHVGYALFGLGWLLEAYPLLLELLRYAGAGFLVWMGSRALRSAPPSVGMPAAAETAAPARHDFLIGLATNLFNPKATLFFVALCSALLTTPTPMTQKLGLAAWIVLTTGAWFSLVALLLGLPAARARLAAKAWLIDRAMGLVLVLLGLGMLLAPLMPT
ncbi:LysE family translocator [Stagnimonas aquatica]|uniref:LysE family translocator n=1 Tax=Stagnimonas aquatica TaxID=2689987 RepID=A0A3N0VI20_9GAMM|nr:LysE family transporter [Stagnimonas aquatica]ROH91858.1 LysE family translocator [Stagnimonas aquatica]